MGDVVGGKSSPSSSPVKLHVLPGVDGSSFSSRFGTTIAGGVSADHGDPGSTEVKARSNSDAQSCGVSGSCRVGAKWSSPNGLSEGSGDRDGDAEL